MSVILMDNLRNRVLDAQYPQIFRTLEWNEVPGLVLRAKAQFA